VIFPVDGQPGEIRLQNITLEAHAGFFSCMVRNFIIDSTATFTMSNSSEESVVAYTLAFPFSTHALYGDHNMFRDIQISIDGTPVSFEVAMDHTLYDIRGTELYYKGRLINWSIHPLIADTTDIRDISSFLIQEGFDMIAYWQMDFAPHEQRVVQIEYTSNSDDFSSCCHEVWDPTSGIEPYYFYFDLSNAHYWQHLTNVHILLHNSAYAIWSAVPQLDLERVCGQTTIEFRGEGISLTEDLAVPAQPNVFGITPRCWPSDEILQQEFALEWVSNTYFFTNTKIYAITGTIGVTIGSIELPLYLSETSPMASFSATLDPAQLSQPSYIDVYGTGMGTYGGLYQIFVRVPITGYAITGHDLAITSLGISDTLEPGEEVTITGVVENRGWFNEDSVLASLYVNGSYVQNAAFSGLNAGEAGEIEIGWTVGPTEVSFLEVEIEPIPGEVNRDNNANRLTTRPTPPAVIYLPLIIKHY
jgi:hypothetical protein